MARRLPGVLRRRPAAAARAAPPPVARPGGARAAACAQPPPGARAPRGATAAPPCSATSTTSSRPHPRGEEPRPREVRHLLRAPAAPALGPRRRAQAAQGRARPGRARRPARHRLRVGGRAPLPRGVPPLARRPRCSSPPPASARRASGSATASCSCRSTSTTPPASPSASPRSTWSPTAGSTSAPASRRRRPSSAASSSTATTKREQWDEALDAVTRMFVEEPFAGYDGEFLQMPPRNVVPKPLQKPHPPLWVACSRRETIHLAADQGHRRARRSPSSSPTRPRQWVDDYYATHRQSEAVRARRLRGEPEPRRRAAVHVPRGRGDGHRARPRRRPLLRLLARPLLRLRQPPARASPTCGTSSRRSASLFGFDRDDRGPDRASCSAPS